MSYKVSGALKGSWSSCGVLEVCNTPMGLFEGQSAHSVHGEHLEDKDLMRFIRRIGSLRGSFGV